MEPIRAPPRQDLTRRRLID